MTKDEYLAETAKQEKYANDLRGKRDSAYREYERLDRRYHEVIEQNMNWRIKNSLALGD